jgi:hypothetical protein
MTLKSQYNKDATTFHVKVNYNFPKKKRDLNFKALNNVLLTKCLWKQGLLFFQLRKWGKYFSFTKYNSFLKIENIPFTKLKGLRFQDEFFF